MVLKQSNYRDTELWKEHPPSDKQYQYAWNISDVLQVKMPKELTMVVFSQFIETHKDAFDKRMKQIKDNIRYEEMIENMKQSELEL